MIEIIFKLLIISELVNLGENNIIARGPIKDAQAIANCEVFAALSLRKDGFGPMRSRDPSDDKGLIRCYIKEFYPCFPKDDIEKYRLQQFHVKPPLEPEYTRDYFCSSGKCEMSENRAHTLLGHCTKCNRTYQDCEEYQFSKGVSFNWINRNLCICSIYILSKI